MPTDPLTQFTASARRLIAARQTLVFVQTHEEARLTQLLQRLAQGSFSQPVPLFIWSATEGLRQDADMVPQTQQPLAALDHVIAYPKSALYLMLDLHRHLDDPLVVRRLRDVHQACAGRYKSVFLCGPLLDVPPECRKEIAVLDLPLPTVDELDQLFTEVCQSQPGLTLELGDRRQDVLRGTLGLTASEARTAYAKVLLGQRRVGPEIIDHLYEEKRTIVRKEGILDYIPPRVALDQIGGLSVLKGWLAQRRRFFSQEAEAFGLNPPKGLLITGVSGCGKSMAVQAISAYWSMPLLRLDMNRIYGGAAGTPERSLEQAIRTAEAIAPCVLWIDEIETALVGTHGQGGGLSTRIFSSFLTWMQEKEQVVFVAATANEIDKLPPELLRKGRFDEIFFVDLPSEQERVEIFTVHLDKRGKDPTQFDLVSLAKSTGGFNGAEIEQVVLSAMYTAFDEQRELTMKDLYRALGRMVPLSTTMAERIKEIKRWADTRAVRASAPG